MTRIFLIGLALAALFLALQTIRRMDPAARRKLGKWAFWILVGGVLLVLLLRFQAYWLAAAGAVLAALLKRGLPWIFKLAPLLHRLWTRRRAQGNPFAEQGPSPGGASGRRARHGMSREEALEVLGLSGNPSKEEVLSAHRELMKKVHPDKPGGSTYLASKVNQAKDTLL